MAAVEKATTVPWWKEPTTDQWYAFGEAWMGWTLDAFDFTIVDRSDVGAGDFDIYFNYGQIQWETGDASGGHDGLGGSCAAAGFSNGTGDAGTNFEIAGSHVCGALIDGGADQLITATNDGVPASSCSRSAMATWCRRRASPNRHRWRCSGPVLPGWPCCVAGAIPPREYPNSATTDGAFGRRPCFMPALLPVVARRGDRVP